MAGYMYDSLSPEQFKQLLKEVTERVGSLSKEHRVERCEQLRLYLNTVTCEQLDMVYSSDGGCDGVLSRLESAITCRGGSVDVKRAVGLCVASLGCAYVDGYRFAEFFTWLRACITGLHVKAEEEKVILLDALHHTLATLNTHEDIQLLKEVLSLLCSQLDETRSPTVFVALIHCVLAVADDSPNVFNDKFEDVIDYTIGWFVEEDVPKAVTDACEQVVCRLDSHWRSRPDFGAHLMRQLLVDVAGFIKDLRSPSSSPSSARETCGRAGAVLRVLAFLMQRFAEWGEMSAHVDKVLDEALTSCACEVAGVAEQCSASACALLAAWLPVMHTVLVMIKEADGGGQQEGVLAEPLSLLLDRCLSVPLRVWQVCGQSTALTTAMCDYYAKVFSDPCVPSDAWLEAARRLLDSRTLSRAAASGKPVVMLSVSRVLSAAMSARALPNLQIAYAAVVAMIESNVALLHSAACALPTTRGGKGGVGVGVGRGGARAAESRLLTAIAALDKLALMKNSLIVMWGARPCVLSVLVSSVPVGEAWLAERHPAVATAAVHMAYKHAGIHDFFLATSEWLTGANGAPIAKGMGESPYGGHAALQLSTLTRLLLLGEKTTTWRACSDMISMWCAGVCNVDERTRDSLLATRPEWRAFKEALWKGLCDKGSGLSGLLPLAHWLGVLHPRSDDEARRKRDELSVAIGRADSAKAVWLGELLPYAVHVGLSISGTDGGMVVGEIRTRRTAFSAADFYVVTDFLLYRRVPSFHQDDCSDEEWLRDSVELLIRQCLSCPPQGDKESPLGGGGGPAPAAPAHPVEQPGDQLWRRWRWVLAQTADFCVENRMRTPLGKPMETFNKFAAEIQRLAKEALSGRAAAENAPRIIAPPPQAPPMRGKRGGREEEEETRDRNTEPRCVSSGCEEWWRVRCLLELLDILDKLIYNAHAAAIFPVNVVSLAARQFFVTNVQSCHEWLCRTYLPAMAVAFHNGHWQQVVRFGWSSLHDLEKRQLRIDAAAAKEAKEGRGGDGAPAVVGAAVWESVCWLVRALVELGSSAAVRGVRAWMSRVYRVDAAWIDAAADIAEARFESGLAGLRVCLLEAQHERGEGGGGGGAGGGGGDNGKEKRPLPDNVLTAIRELMLSAVCSLRLPQLVDRASVEERLSLWTAAAEACDAGGGGGGAPTGFDPAAFSRAHQLCQFGRVERLPEVAGGQTGWDMPRRLWRTELQLMQTMRRSEMQELRDGLAADARLCHTAGGDRLAGRLAVVQMVAAAVNAKIVRAADGEPSQALLSLSPSCAVSSTGCAAERLRLANQLCMWTERLRGVTSGGMAQAAGAMDVVELHLPLAKLARKTGNPLLARTHLQRVMAAAGNQLQMGGAGEQVHRAAGHMVQHAVQYAKMAWPVCQPAERGHHFTLVFDALARSVELNEMVHMQQQQQQQQRQHMWSNGDSMLDEVALLLPPPLVTPSLGGASGEAAARAALQLAEWTGAEPALMARVAPHMERSRLWMQLSMTGCDVRARPASAWLLYAASAAPHLAKTHNKLADWSFAQAEQCLTGSDEERYQLAVCASMLLGGALPTHRVDALWQALARSMDAQQLEESVRRGAMMGDPAGAERLLSADSPFMHQWQCARDRRVSHLLTATRAYFEYLKQRGSQAGCIGSVSATLRLVSLLAGNAAVLGVEMGRLVEQADELVWRDILPQLFARLSHPDGSVRELVCALLDKIGRVSPHSVVYQVVVGASQSMLSGEDDLEEADGAGEGEENAKERLWMRECCVELHARLSAHYPQMVRDVGEFVQRLHAINLLNEERWAFVLQALEGEMQRRLKQIAEERKRSEQAAHLDFETRKAAACEKARVITASVFRLLDELVERTVERVPDTANERHFLAVYGYAIREAHAASRAAAAVDDPDPQEMWTPWKRVLAMLMRNTSHKRGGHTLQMAEISNKLATLSDSRVPLPGQESRPLDEVVTLSKVARHAHVLPTKTRPKKLVFIGSDGVEQPFLFKGQEDLHLDERIMQLLHTCNLMLAEADGKKRSWRLYSARHYAVTPLGARSGLIQWVGGATPLFHIYRKWQMRQASIKAALERKREGGGAAPAADQLERPTDLFHKKLKAAFAAASVEPEVIADRARWPPALLKDVLHQLMKETPRDLLSREMWLGSGGSAGWWAATERLARSAAVMSAVGAVIGLGDRHLDNLLVDLHSGHLVHIDYNVCFDKGRQLRVPETVPFRLTPNLQHAMGPTQIEGTFRHSLSHVLSVLRAGGDTLMTVLAAFVLDPLVDWSANQMTLAGGTAAAVGCAVQLAVYGNEWRGGAAGEEEQRPLARAMFSLRVQEMSVPWMDNCVELGSALRAVISSLEKRRTGEETTADAMVRVQAGGRLKAAIQCHHQHMQQLRPLLRALALCDTRFAEYLTEYKQLFREPLLRGHQMLDEASEDIAACVAQFHIVLQHLTRVYEAILLLEQAPVQKSGSNQLTAPPGYESASAREQHENAMAAGVMRKVRARLEGREGGGKVVDVETQASQLIRQATSLSQLALMYEGWTAWV